LYFLIPFLFVLAMQIAHRRLLVQLLPAGLRTWIPWGLLLIHAPLLAYMGFRFTGHAAADAASLLRPFARGGLYFQVFTFANLACWALSLGLWRLRRRWKRKAVGGPEDPGRRAFLRKSSAAGAGVLLATGMGGAEEAYGDPETTRIPLWFWDLPEGLDGLRIAHLTDLHCGPLVGPGLVRRWRLLAEREKPDLLVITGDFVDSLPGELAAFEEAFRDFPAPLGRFAILGNHDYFTDPGPIWAGLERMGFVCLENRHALVERGGSRLAFLGLQDPMARDGRFLGTHFGPGPMPQDVRLRLPLNAWRLCLCHRPSNWDLARETGARLTLSGHTHGGQINLVPGLSSALLMGPYTSGLYRFQGQVLYVSRGLGVVGLPMRVAASPELAIITLRRKEVPALQPGQNEVS
jgi:hypothetical protein